MITSPLEQPLLVAAGEGLRADREGLLALGRDLRAQYASAAPYPHAVLQGLVADDVLAGVVKELSGVSPDALVATEDRRIVKRELADVKQLGPRTAALIQQLDGEGVRAFLTAMTGVEDLMPDADHFGAGLHETRPGGFTKVHTDFRRHPETHRHHRINLLVYLNTGWLPEFGGALELWPPDMSAVGRRILPQMGTVVVFETNAHTPHGLPDPVTCPPTEVRRSLAVYYYTNDRPSAERTGGKVGSYRRRPGEPRLMALPTAKEALMALVPERVRRAVGHRGWAVPRRPGR